MIQELINAIRLPKVSGCTHLPPSTKLVPDMFDYETGMVECESIASLIDYTKNRETTGTAVFASFKDMAITAVLDWHGTDLVGEGNHQARYSLSLTSELHAWLGINGKLMSQSQFAEFIEEHLDDIHSPAPADVLTVANSLSGKRNVAFKSINNLANGDRSLVWEETTDAKSAGDIRVPSEIVLRIPVFRGAEEATMFEIRALFRYRINDGKLSFEVKLLQVDRIRETAFDHLVEVITEGLNAAFEGKAPAIYRAAIKETPSTIIKKYIHTNP